LLLLLLYLFLVQVEIRSFFSVPGDEARLGGPFFYYLAHATYNSRQKTFIIIIVIAAADVDVDEYCTATTTTTTTTCQS
jgi:hypothetical protein